MEEVADDVHVSSSSREVNEADSSEGSHLESSDAEALDDRCKQLESELQQKQLEINCMQLLMRNQPRLYQQPLTPQNTSMEQPLSHLSLLGAAAPRPGTPTQSLPSWPGTTTYGQQIPAEVNEQIEVLKQQLRVYADDFATEREDRKRNQSEKEKLKEELDAVKGQLGTLEQQRRQSQLCSGDSLLPTASSNRADGNLDTGTRVVQTVLQDQSQQQYTLEDGVAEHNRAIFIPRDDHLVRSVTATVTQLSLQEESHAQQPNPSGLSVAGIDYAFLARHSIDMGLVGSLYQRSEDPMILSEAASHRQPNGWERFDDSPNDRPFMERVPVEPPYPYVTGIENSFLVKNSQDQSLIASLHQGNEGMISTVGPSSSQCSQHLYSSEPSLHAEEHSCSCCLEINERSQPNAARMPERCRPDSGHGVCCVCLQDAFAGGCLILPCSHKVHTECLIAMIIGGELNCPSCGHPFLRRG